MRSLERHQELNDMLDFASKTTDSEQLRRLLSASLDYISKNITSMTLMEIKTYLAATNKALKGT